MGPLGGRAAVTPGPPESKMSASEAGFERLGGGVARQWRRKEVGLPSGEPRGWGC